MCYDTPCATTAAVAQDAVLIRRVRRDANDKMRDCGSRPAGGASSRPPRPGRGAAAPTSTAQLVRRTVCGLRRDGLCVTNAMIFANSHTL